MKTGLLQGPGIPNLNETPRSNDPLFSIEMVISLLIVVFVLVPGLVQAVTIIWTTTADFDTGTYTESAGNREINSNSCNLGIAAGSFELDSLKGDSFCIADADADTFKWDLVTRAAVPCTTATITRSISAGALHVDINTGAGGNCQAGVRTSGTVSGDFDVRVLVDKIATGNANAITILSILNGNSVAHCDGATIDGLSYWWTGSIGGTENLQAYRCNNGVLTQVGTNTAQADPRYLRMTRSGTTFTWYYSSDGSAWTQDEQAVDAGITGNFYMVMTSFMNTVNTQVATDFDDYQVASGTVDAGGFRSSGSWTSATQTFDGTVASQVTVTYSGASTAGYIDAVRIVDSLGATIFSDDTDRTSGSSVAVPVTYSSLLQTNWAVRILLAGDGSATATVESVIVDTSPPPSGEEPPPRGFPGFGLDCRVEIGSVRCIITLPATAGLRILQTHWYMDGSFRGYGIALDDSRQQISLGAPLALAIYRGQLNVTVLVLVSNGQEIRQSEILSVDNSWITFLLILGSVVGVCLILLRMMGKLETRRKRIEKRKGKREDNWRWQLFEKH